MLPLTPQEAEHRKKLIAKCAAEHGLKADGYDVLIPRHDGGVLARVDMSAMDLGKFMTALFHNFAQQIRAGA